MREEGGAKTGIGILGAGEFWQCLKAHRSWLIMLRWEGGGGGLKMCVTEIQRERKAEKI